MNSHHSKIIGSLFALEFPKAFERISIPFIPADKTAIYLNTARAGIYYLVSEVKPEAIWMPSYLCSSMIECISNWKKRIHFYPVDNNLNISDQSWIDSVKGNDLVCIIDYFGFLAPLSIKKKIRAKGACILEDACQAMLTSGVGESADHVLFSPRKFIGVADGGILVLLNQEKAEIKELAAAPVDWWMTIFGASFLRRLFDHQCDGGNDRRWFELHQKADHTVPHGCFAMSVLSRMLLECSFDYEDIASKRRQNYSFLYKQLKSLSLMPEPDKDTVPLGFVIKLKNNEDRDSLRSFLFSNSIYPPVHWQLNGVVPSIFHESHDLSKKIMTIPCDQRYDLNDMDRLSSTILEWMRYSNSS